MAKHKLTQEEVEKLFIDAGCIFDDIYINSNKSYKYICTCGNSDKVYIYNFKKGSRCKTCTKIKMIKSHEFEKFTYEQVKEYVESFEYKLLSQIYINSKQYIELLCPKGHNYRVKFKAFKNNKNRCNKCCTRNIKKEYNYVKNIFESQGYLLRTKTYKNIKNKMDVTCPVGHEYSVSLYNFETRGSRCTKCYYKSICGEGHPRYKNFSSKQNRLNYLHIEKNKIKDLLYDDPNYNSYIKNIKDKTGKNIYSIDHIFPRIAFIDNDLDKIYKSYQIKEICNSKDNLRIILNSENNSKNGKYNQEEFLNWFKNHPKYFLLEKKGDGIMGDLRKNFSKKEFACKHCGIYEDMDNSLLDGLQLLSDNTNCKIIITSGRRCPKHPIEVKKKTPGEHSRCRAADIIISGMDQLDMLAEALKIPQFKNGGIGIYPQKGIIHVDTRPNGPARWSYINGVQKSFSEGYQLLLKQKK